MVVFNTKTLGVESARVIVTDLLKARSSMMSSLSSNVIGKLALVIDEITKVETDNDTVVIYCEIDGNDVIVEVSDEINVKMIKEEE